VDIAQVVAARKDNSRVKNVQDLSRNDALVGVQTGTTGEHLLLVDALVQDKNLRRYDNVSLALADLKVDAIDAVVDDQPILLNFLSTPEFRGQLIVVGPLSQTESYGIVARKGDTALLQQINAAIKRLRDEGVLDRLVVSYHLR
jgi:polar amino acid transport system substrate-binding protein